MSVKNGAALTFLVLWVLWLVALTIFGFVVLFAAFAASSGGLQVAIGVYIVLSVINMILTLVINSAMKKSKRF